MNSAIVIGLGNIGMLYDYDLPEQITTHCRAIDSHPEFELSGAVDINEKNLKLFEKKYNKPTYNNIENAIVELQPDLIVISNPTDQHYTTLKKIFSHYSPKIILLEKPVSSNYKESIDILNISKERSIPVAVNYFRQFEKTHKEISNKILNGEIGFPVKINVSFSDGFFNNASHYLIYLLKFLDGFKDCIIISKNKINNGLDFNLDLQITFENGEVFFISHPKIDYALMEMEIYGPKGSFKFFDHGKKISFRKVENDNFFPGHKILSEKKNSYFSEFDKYQYHVYENISKYLNNESGLYCDIFDLENSFNIFKKIEERI